MNPYVLLAKKRQGGELSTAEIGAVVKAAATRSWSDAQLGAFLMAVAIQGLTRRETRDLTESMRSSGDVWDLGASVPGVVDKHSTGGVGDTVTLVLGPLLASCGVPTVMLTGRSLGHTGGTADKLESIPGLDLALDRNRTLKLLDDVGLAIGIATEGIAPADRTFYRLRDQTATVSSIPLVIGSILSKKLAVGPSAIVFDVKTGSGAVFPEPRIARELAQRLVETSCDLGCPASALLTDMSQPLGAYVGHVLEVRGALEVLEGGGEGRLREVTLALAEQIAVTRPDLGLARSDFETAFEDGSARESFDRWALAQGAEASWVASPVLDAARVETVIESAEGGALSSIDTQALGLRLTELWRPGDAIEMDVGLHLSVTLGQAIEPGSELGRVYSRAALGAEEVGAIRSCFEVSEVGHPPTLVQDRIGPVD